MSNTLRRSLEGFEVSGRINKDVTLAHTAFLNEDGLMWKPWAWREAAHPPPSHLLHKVARPAYSRQVLEESPALKQSMLRRSGPGRSQEEEIDDVPSKSGNPMPREPNPETQIRQSWLKR